MSALRWAAVGLAALMLLPAVPAASIPAAAMRMEGALVRDSYGPLSAPSSASPESIAAGYLASHATELGLPAAADLRAVGVKTSLTATHHHFQQFLEGLPVIGGRVSVHVRNDGAIVAVHSGAVPTVAPLVDRIDAARAGAIAQSAAPGAMTRAEPVVFAAAGEGRHAWEVSLLQRGPTESWLVHVDRETGEVLAAEDQIQRFEAPANVWVHPILHSGNPILEDNQMGLEKPLPGQTGHDFSQWYQPRTLVDLEETANGGRLVGPYATVVDAVADGSDMRFARDDPRFEEVNAYYWIDWTQRTIQSLGFTDLGNFSGRIYVHDEVGMHGAYYGGAPVMPEDEEHGAIHMGFHAPVGAYTFGGRLEPIDPSGFLTNGQRTRVSDASEDAEVLVHEYGHMLFRDAEARAYGPVNEGFSDFLAASMLSRIANGSFEACVHEWLEHYTRGPAAGLPAIPACRRIIDNELSATAENVDIYHHACQIYSGALWDVRKEMGRDASEKWAMEALFYMGDGKLEVAAEALLMADSGLTGGAFARRIVEEFASRNVTDIIVTPDLLETIRGGPLDTADVADDAGGLNALPTVGALGAAGAAALLAAARRRR